MITTEQSYEIGMSANDYYELERAELFRLIREKGSFYTVMSRSWDSGVSCNAVEIVDGFLLTEDGEIVSSHRWSAHDDNSQIPRLGAKVFGSWVLVGDQLVLPAGDGHDTLYVDLESCNCSAQILDWIFHYRDRLTHQEMADLLQAFESILHPRQNYCGDGVDKGADPLLLLDQWLNPKPRRKPIKPSVRFQILKRDGYRCQMCGVSAKDGATLEIDHITPVSKGGSNDPENLQVLCRDCNAGKSDHLL